MKLRALKLCSVAVALSLFCVLSPSAWAGEPTIEPLWPEGAPGALGEEAKDNPQLFTYFPEEGQASGASIVICPGGGYWGLAWDYEGTDVAQWFTTLGVTASVVHYRTRSEGYGYPAPQDDAQRAIRILRSRADEWGLDPERVGIMGFSAGGHLAASVATQNDAGDPDSDDSVAQESCRPNFCILAYPVITLTEPHTHLGSQHNLLGENAPTEQIEALSCERNVTADTPPTFLFHTYNDNGVPAENSILFWQALREAGVPAELHIFEPGGHGVGMAKSHPALGVWTDLAANWLRERGIVPAEQP